MLTETVSCSPKAALNGTLRAIRVRNHSGKAVKKNEQIQQQKIYIYVYILKKKKKNTLYLLAEALWKKTYKNLQRIISSWIHTKI